MAKATTITKDRVRIRGARVSICVNLRDLRALYRIAEGCGRYAGRTPLPGAPGGVPAQA